MDTVGQPLALISKKFKNLGIKYQVFISQPSRNVYELNESEMYIIRQRVDENIYHLVAAAKMKKATD